MNIFLSVQAMPNVEQFLFWLDDTQTTTSVVIGQGNHHYVNGEPCTIGTEAKKQLDALLKEFEESKGQL